MDKYTWGLRRPHTPAGSKECMILLCGTTPVAFDLIPQAELLIKGKMNGRVASALDNQFYGLWSVILGDGECNTTRDVLIAAVREVTDWLQNGYTLVTSRRDQHL